MSPEDLFEHVCSDRREAFKTLISSGKIDDESRAHFETCLDCQVAVAASREMRSRETPPKAPLTAASRKGEIIAVSVAGIAAAALLGIMGYLIYTIATCRPKTQTEWMTDASKHPPTFFVDERVQLCFSRFEFGRVEPIACADAPQPVAPAPDWFRERSWYYQDTRTGVCYGRVYEADRGYEAIGFYVVPCANVEPLFNAMDGRFRYQRWTDR